MKTKLTFLLGLSLATIGYSQTQATLSPGAGDFIIDDQYNSYGAWIRTWFSPNATTFDMFRVTDSTNGGAPLNAYMDNHFVVDRAGGVATLKLVEANIDYNNLMNKPATPGSPSFSNPTRTLNSAFQPSTTRNALVSYSVDIACSATLIGGQTGTVFLEYADDSGFTTNVVEVGRFVNGNSVSLAIAITVNQTNTGTISGMIPANKYVRLRTANTVGSPTFNYRVGQEVLL